MVKEVGGGIGMGNTCKPTAVSFQCMTKSTTIKKIIIIIIIGHVSTQQDGCCLKVKRKGIRMKSLLPTT